MTLLLVFLKYCLAKTIVGNPDDSDIVLAQSRRQFIRTVTIDPGDLIVMALL